MWNNQTGIEVTLNELINLRYQALHQPVNSANKWLTLSGQKLTRIRGRGLEFDTTREYQAGDDIRSMAWRVTARSLKPHIKVYQEEKERTVWLAVDLSPSLYFGTRTMFKSARSIIQAGFLGWSYLIKREQVGAMIAADQQLITHQPHASEQNFLGILNSLSKCSQRQPAYTETSCLKPLLTTLQHQVRSGSLIFIISDFYQFDTEVEKLILHLAQRSHVVLNFIYDPIESDPPPPHQYILTNGKENISFHMNNAQSRANYQQQFQMKKEALSNFALKYNLKFQMLRTDQMQEV